MRIDIIDKIYDKSHEFYKKNGKFPRLLYITESNLKEVKNHPDFSAFTYIDIHDGCKWKCICDMRFEIVEDAGIDGLRVE